MGDRSTGYYPLNAYCNPYIGSFLLTVLYYLAASIPLETPASYHTRQMQLSKTLRDAFPGFVDFSDRVIVTGDWVYTYRDKYPKVDKMGLDQSHQWRVTEPKDGKLALVGQDKKATLLLTKERARWCHVFEPADALPLDKFPKEVQRWKAAGWDLFLQVNAAGGLQLCSHSFQSGRSSGCSTSVEEMEAIRQDPDKGKPYSAMFIVLRRADYWPLTMASYLNRRLTPLSRRWSAWRSVTSRRLMFPYQIEAAV